MNRTLQPIHIDTLSKVVILCAILFGIVVVAAYLIHPSFIRSINNKATDAILACQKNAPPTSNVVIIDIDDKSLAKYGQWPWPRYRVSQLLQKINSLGASSIGINIIMAEPDRTSPKHWQSAIAQELGYMIDISRIPRDMVDHDRSLAETLAKGPFVLSYEFLFKGKKENKAQRLHPVNAILVNSNNEDLLKSTIFTALDVTNNLRQFSDAVAYSGFLNATPDADGILRRVPLLIQFDKQFYPSFALASLMQSGKISQIQLVTRQNGFLDVVVGGTVIKMDNHGNVAINFLSISDKMLRLSAVDLLGGNVSINSLKDKIALVGSSASGLGKSYQTAAFMINSDVEFQARLIENLLSGKAVVRPDSFLLWEALFGVLASLLLCVAIFRMEILGSTLISALLVAGSSVGAVVMFQKTGLLFSPVLPTLLLLSSYTLFIILKSLRNQKSAMQKTDETLVLLKSSENNLSSIINAVPDIIFRLDSNGHITFLSPAISKYTDSPDQLIGQPIFDLVAPDSLEKAKYRLNEKRTGKRATHDLEIRLLLPHQYEGNGDMAGLFSVSAEGIYCSETPNSKDFIGTQGIMRDISEQKKLEERLQHAEKMEVVGSLAAGVAHDLNNVLCGLVAYPELILLELPEGSPLRNMVTNIQKSGQKAAAIVEDLLTLARRGVKATEIANLNSIVNDYLQSPEFEAKQKDHPTISIETSLASDLLNVNGSRLHLTKSIMNILNNAAEAMPVGGKIQIETCNRYLETPLNLYERIPSGEFVCLTVADEGVGIDNDDLQKIFEPFYSKKSMKRSGSGLGMTIIWATIKDCNGYLDIQSSVGDGTKIIMYLPASRETDEVVLRRINLEEYLGSEHVHIVDDMPLQIDIAGKMLAKLGYKVTSSASGEAAVEFLRNNNPDLVVLDMIMPGGMDGLETYQKMLEIHPHQKVVIASGFSESERVVSAQQLGAGSYIQKPYTMEKFGVAVRREIDKKIA